MILTKLYKLKNIFYKFYNPKLNYCGTYERQAFFTKWIPIHKVFKGINLGCYYHDCRYTIIFNLNYKYITNYFVNI